MADQHRRTNASPEEDDLGALQALIRRLRADDGCPWDRKQTLGSVRAYLLEEAHEAAQAIDSEDPEALRDELGDLLFQAAFVGVLAEERGDFTLSEAMASVHRKMVERHPHVFGDERDEGEALDAAAVTRRWERRKASRMREGSVLDGVPSTLPSLVAAYRLGQKAAGVGFDWPDVAPVLGKVREELAEVEAEIEQRGAGEPAAAEGRLRAEVGDLLFAVANLARHLGVDPEAALAHANSKFRRRFSGVEKGLAGRGLALTDATLADMDEIWEQEKRSETAARGSEKARLGR